MPIKVSPTLIAVVVEWDQQKGYGFLQIGTERIFLHRRDFSARHRTPVAGDTVQFSIGQDFKGRVCAQNALLVNGRSTSIAVYLLVLTGLLILPAIAAFKTGASLTVLAGGALALNALTYWAYTVDKRRAQTGRWRLPEIYLHLLELSGGWPGAWLAQRWLRHKCSKGSYLVVFWSIVLAWHFVAVDSLQNWRFSRAALHWMEQSLKHRG